MFGEQVSITVPVVVTFVTFACVMMFVLFFLLNRYIFYIFIAIFSYGTCIATAVCLQTALHACMPALSAPVFTVPHPKVTVRCHSLVAGTAAVGLVLVWLLNRHASWAWLPQNLLGMSFMILIMQSISLPNLRVGMVFLVALFCYDIFMVFITPLFMPHGDSVMVRVARGGAAHEVGSLQSLGLLVSSAFAYDHWLCAFN
jgi:signal peptide peptidase-like 2B